MLQKPQIQNSVFDDIRAGFSRVAAQAQFVRIRTDRLVDYVRTLPDRHPSSVFDTTHHFIGTPETTTAYVLALDAINYGSGFKPDLVAEGWAVIEGSIYYSVSVRLKNRFEVAPLTAPDLSSITADDMHDILELPRKPQGMRLAALFAEGLHDLGQLIERDYQGRFMSFVESAQGRAGAIVSALGHLPQFHDVHNYNGMPVPLFKRAQIAAADLHLAFSHLGIKLFDDMDQLTMFPDNGVPQVLLADGILEYDPALRARICREEEILSGSAEEIEIRACAGQVVEQLAALSGKIPVAIDHMLWHRHAEEARYKSFPSHKTLCVFY